MWPDGVAGEPAGRPWSQEYAASSARPVLELACADGRRLRTPEDPTTYRCDHLVDDVEALYAARYREHINRLVLVTPSPRVVAVEITD